MKTYLLWIITLLSIASYSQGKCIAISKKNSERLITIEENKRIKVVTADGEKHWGRFTVVDSATIMMNGNKIPLNSIVKIRRKSLVEAIAEPVVVTFGVIAVPGGLLTGAMIAVMADAGLGAAIAGGSVVTGGALIALPFIPNTHRASKNWEYAIRSNESNPFSNKIKVGQSESKESPTGKS